MASRTARPGEFVEAVIVPKLGLGRVFRIYKLSKRFDQEFRRSAAPFLGVEGGRSPTRGSRSAAWRRRQSGRGACEAALAANPGTRPGRGGGGGVAQDFTPIGDMRASADYRLRAAKNLLLSAFAGDRRAAACGRASEARGPWRYAAPRRAMPAVSHAAIAHDSAAKHVTGAALYIDDMPEPAGTAASGVGQSAPTPMRASRHGFARGARGARRRGGADGQGYSRRERCRPVAGDDPLFAEAWSISSASRCLRSSRQRRRPAPPRGWLVEYEELPALPDHRRGAAAGSLIEARQTHARWAMPPRRIAAAPHGIAGQLAIGGQDHFYLEGQVALAVPGEDGDMHVYSSTQHPTEVQHLVAHVLGLPHARDGRGAPHGRRLRRQGNPGGAVGGHRRAGRGEDRAPGQDPPRPRRRHGHDRQAARFRHRLGGGFRRRRPPARRDFELASRCGHSADLSLAINDRAMFHADNAYFLPATEIISHRLQDPYRLQHRLPRLRRAAGMMAIERVMDAIADPSGQRSAGCAQGQSLRRRAAT